MKRLQASGSCRGHGFPGAHLRWCRCLLLQGAPEAGQAFLTPGSCSKWQSDALCGQQPLPTPSQFYHGVTLMTHFPMNSVPWMLDFYRFLLVCAVVTSLSLMSHTMPSTPRSGLQPSSRGASSLSALCQP